MPQIPANNPERYSDGKKLPVFDNEYTIRILPHSSRDQILLVKDEAVIYVKDPNTESRRINIVVAWYRAILQKRIKDLMPKCEELTGLKADSCHVKMMRTRWGTCNPKEKRLWISLLLAQKPMECLQYIIIHELTHIAEAKHTKRFYDLVAQAMPNWKEVQNKLNGK